MVTGQMGNEEYERETGLLLFPWARLTSGLFPLLCDIRSSEGVRRKVLQAPACRFPGRPLSQRTRSTLITVRK